MNVFKFKQMNQSIYILLLFLLTVSFSCTENWEEIGRAHV